MKSKVLNRREFGKRASAATSLICLNTMNQLYSSESDQQPNILIIQPDQHRGTIMGCAGDKQVKTPNLDRLASEGIRFSHCVSNSPVCSPFRGTMQTGFYWFQHGVVSNNIRMDLNLKTIAEYLTEQGYASGYIGKWHLDGDWPEPFPNGKRNDGVRNLGFVPKNRRQGWQEWLGYEKSHQFFNVAYLNESGKAVRMPDYNWEPTWYTDKALEFINKYQSKNKPWVYYIAYGPPHLPKECPEQFLDMYPPESFELPPDVEMTLSDDQKDELRKELQIYYAQVTSIDVEIGRLLRGLQAANADQNTIILYTSDHGDLLGSHFDKTHRMRGKGRPYVTALQIPLIIRWPQKIKAQQTTDIPVSSIDLAPTILDLAGINVPNHMAGHSMAGWCYGTKGYENKYIYLGLGHGKPLPRESIRPSERQKMKPGDRKISGFWRAIWDGRFLYYPDSKNKNQRGWLYDHLKDPYEMTNLIDSPDHQDIKNRLGKHLVAIAKETDDPVYAKLQNEYII